MPIRSAIIAPVYELMHQLYAAEVDASTVSRYDPFMTESGSLEPEQWALWDTWMHAQRLLTREIDRQLQREFGISKAEFSVLVTLLRSPDSGARVMDLAQSLCWEKSRVAHQLTRMEKRELVARVGGASGRRTGIELTPEGRSLAKSAITMHADNVRRFFLDTLSTEQACAIRAWSESMVKHLGRHDADADDSD
ncbi:MarR family winged helix-turn-helix transcriptional regulator [Salinisphaera aquimarina]